MDTILTSTNLVDAEAFCEALIREVSSAGYDELCRGLGLTRVSYWLDRGPDVVVTMWEGRDVHGIVEYLATSSDPVVAKWRGLMRMWAGPGEMDRFWDAERHRLLSWATEEQGAESELIIERNPKRVDAYVRLARDFQNDPSLFLLLGKVRGRQGLTRIELWHESASGQEILLNLVEGHDLKGSMAQIMAEENELDQRTMEVVRSTFQQSDKLPPTAKLLARWQA